ELRLPPAQLPGAACLALGFVTLVHWARGALPTDDTTTSRLVTVALSPEGATTLTGLAVLLAIMSEGLARFGRVADAPCQSAAASGAALAGLVTVLPEERAPPPRGAMVYGVTGLGALAVNHRWKSAALTAVGSVVLAGAAVFVAAWAAPGMAPE